MKSKSTLEERRHTLAHLLAAAVMELYPKTKRTIGPAIDNGFYFDFDFGDVSIVEADLQKIEEKMKEILPTWADTTKHMLPKEKALAEYPENPFKEELINEFSKDGDLSFYKNGQYWDLCRGGHSDFPSKEIQADSFKLDRIAGAYWRGDANNKQLTRIYGLAFDTKEELDKYIWQQEEAKKRDHRLLGEKLDLFTFDESIGKGLPIWLPKGNIIKEELERWAKETEDAWGYSRITTPIITKENLFITSGHLPLYKESMYAPLSIEGENYYIKPMNCPFHHKAFAARPKTYKDLPLRLCEYGWCHRYEDSGSLFGLMRVRGMQMNDAHIYIQKEKAVEEFVNVIKMHEFYYKILGINDYQMELALRDPSNMDKYHGDEQDWKDAEAMTKEAMEKSGVKYVVVNEGAAFYGPKMDFQIFSTIGRTFTASTNQLDLYMGKAFDLQYVDRDGQRKVPAIIHRAPLGTHERFIGFLIEHFAGAFPVWLSPVQVAIVAVKEDLHGEYANSVFKALRDANIRVEIDDRKESLGKRIRAAKDMKVPYVIVIGDKEKDSGKLTVETRGEKIENISVDQFVSRVREEIVKRTLN
jgi:threonyl-tRNA synthetase